MRVKGKWLDVTLKNPPEPDEEFLKSATEIDIDKKVASHLWKYWKNDLKLHNIDWQVFVGYASRTHCNRYLHKETSWGELVQEYIVSMAALPGKGKRFTEATSMHPRVKRNLERMVMKKLEEQQTEKRDL